jgi:hypothetical protein
VWGGRRERQRREAMRRRLEGGGNAIVRVSSRLWRFIREMRSEESLSGSCGRRNGAGR